MSKKKIIIAILFVGILVGFIIRDDIKRNNSAIIHCDMSVYDENGEIESIIESAKESIPCSNNKDCSSENMRKYCDPGFPALLKCVGAKYYCGDDSKCRGYDCF